MGWNYGKKNYMVKCTVVPSYMTTHSEMKKFGSVNMLSNMFDGSMSLSNVKEKAEMKFEGKI